MVWSHVASRQQSAMTPRLAQRRSTRKRSASLSSMPGDRVERSLRHHGHVACVPRRAVRENTSFFIGFFGCVSDRSEKNGMAVAVRETESATCDAGHSSQASVKVEKNEIECQPCPAWAAQVSCHAGSTSGIFQCSRLGRGRRGHSSSLVARPKSLWALLRQAALAVPTPVPCRGSI
jgi:hypothetical protein